jgi:hypothetical protein
MSTLATFLISISRAETYVVEDKTFEHSAGPRRIPSSAGGVVPKVGGLFEDFFVQEYAQGLPAADI